MTEYVILRTRIELIQLSDMKTQHSDELHYNVQYGTLSNPEASWWFAVRFLVSLLGQEANEIANANVVPQEQRPLCIRRNTKFIPFSDAEKFRIPQKRLQSSPERSIIRRTDSFFDEYLFLLTVNATVGQAENDCFSLDNICTRLLLCCASSVTSIDCIRCGQTVTIERLLGSRVSTHRQLDSES
jgi:hypothetical protein